MVVYADVLVVLNLMVDYFLLRLSAIFLKTSVRLWRLLLGAFLGAVSSLYIFAPQLNIAFELIFRILLCAIITLTVFGLGGIKKYLRCFFTFTSVTFGYAGAMIGVWYLFKPYGMVINNSVVYFNISPLWLTVFTVTAYFIVFFVRKVAAKETGFCGKCSLSVFAEGVNVSLTALIDTGNSIEDVFLHSEIIVTDESVLYKLF